MEKVWTVYMLRCCDGTLYTGVSNNVAARLEAHRAGLGAKYTKGRSPLELVYTQVCPDKVTAFQREYAIKRMTRKEKLQLCAMFKEEDR